MQVYSAEQTAAIKNVVHELTNQLIISPFGNYLIQGWRIKKNYLDFFYIVTVFKFEKGRFIVVFMSYTDSSVADPGCLSRIPSLESELRNVRTGSRIRNKKCQYF